MGGPKETNEEKQAKELARMQQEAAADAAKEADLMASADAAKKKAAKLRAGGMQGGGREGLMYKGNQTGTKYV